MTSPPTKQESVLELTTPCSSNIVRLLTTPSKVGQGHNPLVCCVPLSAWQLKLLFLFPPTLSLHFYLASVYRGSQDFGNTSVPRPLVQKPTLPGYSLPVPPCFTKEDFKRTQSRENTVKTTMNPLVTMAQLPQLVTFCSSCLFPPSLFLLH